MSLDSVHPLQPPLQFLRAVAGLGLAPPLGLPLRAFHHPVILGTPRGVPVQTHLQADQPQRQVSRQVTPRTPRHAVVHPEPLGPSPVAEGQAELRLDRRRRDLSPPAPGGKPRSRGPRRCTRRQPVAHRRAGQSGGSPTRPRPSARPGAAARPAGSRRRVAAPPARGQARLGGTSVAACVRQAAGRSGVGGATPRGPIPLPR